MTKIQIHTDPDLAKLTHAVGETAAESLARNIAKIEAQGITVKYARSYRCAVPNSYGPTYKVRAPYYVYDGSEITLIDGPLESRPHGATIPAQFTIAWDVVPDGYRCFRRDTESNELLVRKA